MAIHMCMSGGVCVCVCDSVCKYDECVFVYADEGIGVM